MPSPIDSPLTLSFAGMPVAPLRFFLEPDYTPVGIVHDVGDGVTATVTPSYVEWGLPLTGGELTAVLYQFQISDDVDWLGACLSDAVTPLHQAMTGPDYGAALTALIAEQWPEFYAQLADSTANVPATRKLGQVITNETPQWIVADELSGARRRSIAIADAGSLVRAALETFHKATHPSELRGILEVYAQPDRRGRRLNAIAGLLKAPQSIMNQFENGLQSLNPFELVQLAGECLDHVKEFKR